ncbi:sugar phosphate isomerase/epimerase family protein [uncultured Algibacter sp.]|uniref:sugar phosphate isomerase/epimerase family protein n=1 Tax=uncultured Algibacter sp. TaxID=298659 RepID=UPI002621BAF4|nr:sugar phosphate isomerase/epimerase family protein [uncultured Algibacter sp.]
MNAKTFKPLLNITLGVIMLSFFACNNKTKKQGAMETNEVKEEVVEAAPFFKVSLAQWSLHKSVRESGVSPFNFAKEAKSLGINAIEYVNQLYTKEIETLGFDAVIDSLKAESEKHGVTNVLIMIDHEGYLAHPDEAKRNEAVENHKKWVDAAKKLGCHAIRVNASGTDNQEEWDVAAIDGLKRLAEYAATQNINVLVENHNDLSSNPVGLAKAMKAINLPNCGTLPDFGNWCIRKDEAGTCTERYPDIYEATQMLMPFAKAVSAKTYNFDETGNETTIDFVKMMQIVKDAGYTGYVGIEYEGDELGEKEGIIATMKLLEKATAQLK